jgi:hypothetical protein
MNCCIGSLRRAAPCGIAAMDGLLSVQLTVSGDVGRPAGAHQRVARGAVLAPERELHEDRAAARAGLEAVEEGGDEPVVLGCEDGLPGLPHELDVVERGEPGRGAKGEGNVAMLVELDEQVGAREGEGHEAVEVPGHAGA